MRRRIIVPTLVFSMTACPNDPPRQEAAPARDEVAPPAIPSGHDPLGGGGQHGKASETETFGPPVDVTPSGQTRTERAAELAFDVPVEWVSTPPSSGMRLAEIELPGPGGGASLKVYRFRGAGGSASANIDRWVGQMAQPDGKESHEVAIVEAAERDGLTFTRVDVSGRFAGQQLPGAPAMAPIADARLMAFVVEGSGDPVFFKLIGPRATVDVWAEAFAKTTESTKVTPP